MKVLIACEESQEVCKAFRTRGHEAYSCDIQEPSGGHPEWHILGDALKAVEGGQVVTMDGVTHDVGKWDLLIAHPPCTHLAPSLDLPVYTLPENNDEEQNAKREELTTCLSDAELSKYLGIHPGWGWHISDLKIWDEPVRLKDFWGRKPCKHGGDCCTCLQWDNMKEECCASRYISRPPQSWCYMEDGG